VFVQQRKQFEIALYTAGVIVAHSVVKVGIYYFLNKKHCINYELRTVNFVLASFNTS
jgi:hypothetical protein